MILLFYWLLYSAITETQPCDLELIALLLSGLMYGKLNHYVIMQLLKMIITLESNHLLTSNQNQVVCFNQTFILVPCFN